MAAPSFMNSGLLTTSIWCLHDLRKRSVMALFVPTGTRAFDDHDSRAVGRFGDVVDRRPERLQIGSPVVPLRRTHREEDDGRRSDRLLQICRKGEPALPAVPGTSNSCRPGSKIGTLPAVNMATFLASTSMPMTSLPLSAKQVAVTKPT